MRSRARVMVPVVAFAVAVALVAALAGRGGDGQKLVKLPVGSVGGAGTEADSASATTMASAARTSMAYAPSVEYKRKGTWRDLPDKAPGYRLSDAATEDAIRKVAGVLGIDGPVHTEESSWVVQDGERALRVMKVPGLPWYVEPSCPDAPVSENEKVMAVACAGVAVGVAAPARTVAGSNGALPQDMPATTIPIPVPSCPPGVECVVAEPAPAPVCAPDATCTKPAIDPMPPVTAVAPPDRPARPDGFPTRAEAEKLARDTFAKLGAGSDGMVLEDGWATWEARVGMRLDGLEVLGMDTSVSIGAHGVERANGWLAAPERIGDYPLVGIEAGFKRLTTPPPVPAPETRLVAPAPPVATDDAAGVATEEPSTTMVIEPMPPMEPFVQTIVGAHLALLNTGQALVPAYVFELDGGGAIPVPAVTDEWLDTTGSPARD